MRTAILVGLVAGVSLACGGVVSPSVSERALAMAEHLTDEGEPETLAAPVDTVLSFGGYSFEFGAPMVEQTSDPDEVILLVPYAVRNDTPVAVRANYSWHLYDVHGDRRYSNYDLSRQRVARMGLENVGDNVPPGRWIRTVFAYEMPTAALGESMMHIEIVEKRRHSSTGRRYEEITGQGVFELPAPTPHEPAVAGE